MANMMVTLKFLRIKAIENRLPQKAIAEKSGLDPAYVSNVLNAKLNPGLENLIKIAGAIGYEIEWRKIETDNI